MKLIDKDALIAKIKKRFDEYSSSILRHYDPYKEARAQELGKILTILGTLEVKEVDLEKERTEKCPFRVIICTRYEDKILECDGACSWVVDCPKLEKLKEQKRE